MRNGQLTDQGLRSPSSTYNASEYEAIYKRAKARLDNPAKLIKRMSEAYAAGEPGLQDQQAVQYMTEEARARSFADQFGMVVSEGAPNQVPYMVFLEPDKVDVYDVALDGKSKQRIRKVHLYTTTDTYTSAGWKELTTPVIEYDGDNPFFPDKAPILRTQSMDLAAYYMQRDLDTIAWDTLTAAVGTFTGKKIWTHKDTDVQDLPTTNDLTGASAQNFWRALREELFPYFDNQNKGGMIDIHVRTGDLKHLFKIAPVGVTLGEYSTFQERVFEGNYEAGMTIYGHRIRIHPENNRIASGVAYARVGPTFKMWLPMAGATQNVVPQTPGYVAFRLRSWYAVLQPSLWNSNVAKLTWSTSATADP